MSGATTATAAAIVGAGALGAAGTAYAGSQAASAQKSAANQANQTEQNFFNIDQANAQPFIQSGQGATSEINALEGQNGGNSASIMNTLQGLPGYQFANTQGLKSVQNNATARGLGLSGAALKGAASYSTGYANQQYNNLLGGLQATANTGANAAYGLGNNATTTGSNIASNQLGAGNAQAASNIATGNALTGVASSVPTGLITSQLLQNMQNQSGVQSGIYSGVGNYQTGNSVIDNAPNNLINVGG